MKLVKTHKDLDVFKLSFDSGMKIFELSKSFPKSETYSLTDQIRRSSRSVSGNIAEAFRKRRYPRYFISKLTDSEGESAETQVWLDYWLFRFVLCQCFRSCLCHRFRFKLCHLIADKRIFFGSFCATLVLVRFF